MEGFQISKFPKNNMNSIDDFSKGGTDLYLLTKNVEQFVLNVDVYLY